MLRFCRNRRQAFARLDDWLSGLGASAELRRLARHLRRASKGARADRRHFRIFPPPHRPCPRRSRSAAAASARKSRKPSPERCSQMSSVRSPAMTDEGEAMALLRRTKAEAALLIAITDIGTVWPVLQVTRALTELADRMVQGAVRFLLNDAVRRGRLTPADPAEPERGSGYIVLAMGKMGAFELNYSSDIDLIVFYDPEAPAIPDRDRSVSALHPGDARTGEAAAGAHRRRLRVPRGPAAAAGPGLDPGRDLGAGGAGLLRASRAELGTLGDDQGASLRRRHRGGREAAEGAVAVRVAQIHGFRRACRHPRDEAADPRLSRARRDRGRRPQHQARPRRHPRDRVFRPDPAIDRGRPPSRVARSPYADDALGARGRAVGRRACRARAGGGLSVLAAGRTPAADGRG